MDQDAVSLLISFYAAMLSTTVFVWNIAIHIRDRGRIKISGFFGQSIDNINPPKKILYFEFVNIGTKPIYIIHFGGRLKRKYVKGKFNYFMINTPGIQKRLEPSEVLQITFDTLEAFNSIDHRIKKMFVTDSTGKKHYMKKRLLKSLVEQKKTLFAP